MRLPRLLHSFGWIAAGEAASKAAGFLGFAYLARTLGPTGYGALELAVAVAMLGYLVVDFGLGPVAARRLAGDASLARGLVRAVARLRIGLALAYLAVAALAAHVLAADDDARALILAFSAALLAAAGVRDWLFQGLNRVERVAPAQLLRMTGFAVGAVVFVHGPSQLLRVGALEIGSMSLLAIYYLWASRDIDALSARDDGAAVAAAGLWREALPVGTGQALWAANQYLPTLAVALWLGEREVAFYGAAHRIVFALGSFVFLYFFTLYPRFVRAIDARDGSLAHIADVSLRAGAWLAGAAAMLAATLAEPICRLAFGPGFEAAAPAFAILVWVLPVSLLSGHARFALIAAGRQERQTWAQAAGAAATLLLCALLVPRFGLRGAALALLGATSIVWALTHVAMRRHVEALPGWRTLWRPGLALGVAATALQLLAPRGPWQRAALAASLLLVAAAALERATLARLRDTLAGGAT